MQPIARNDFMHDPLIREPDDALRVNFPSSPDKKKNGSPF